MRKLTRKGFEELNEAIKDIVYDCAHLARDEHLEKGERAAWKAMSRKASRALKILASLGGQGQ